MFRRLGWHLLPVALFALQAGCGGSSSFKPTVPLSGNVVTVTLKDAPPANVTILSFHVTVSGAVLNPGNIDLLTATGPQDIDVERLQVENAFLSTASVPANAGPFTSLSLTFANPELTIVNGTGSTLANCPSGPNPCRIMPTGVLNATVNFNPSLSLPAGSSAGLLVDLNVNNILTNALGVDFGSAQSITVSATVAGPNDQSGEMSNVEEVSGRVANKGTANFDLQTDDRLISGIQVDSNTTFSGFKSCTKTPPDFSCVQNGQIVDVNLSLLASGALLAKNVTMSGMDGVQGMDEEIDGTVVSVDTSANQFSFVVSNNLSLMPNTILGTPLLVQVQPGARFKVDVEEEDQNAGLASTFADITSLFPGQSVGIHRLAGDGSTATPLTTDRVKLGDSRITAPVSAKIDANTFTLDVTGNAVFKLAGITSITVDATHARFEGLSGVGGLTLTPIPDVVSVRGWLFKQASGTPLLVATKVRKH